MKTKDAKKSLAQRATTRIKEDSERSARVAILEELFYDFNRSKTQIYWMNLQRGIMFGIGSVIGGALIIAILGVLLSVFVDLPGGIGEFVQRIINAMNNGR